MTLLYVYLCVCCLSVCLSTWMYVCLYVCLFCPIAISDKRTIKLCAAIYLHICMSASFFLYYLCDRHLCLCSVCLIKPNITPISNI